MKVLVTGANGFLGTHLVKALSEKPDIDVIEFKRDDNLKSLHEKLINADFIFHLAGANRPKNNDEFIFSNVQLTEEITNFLNKFNIKSPIYFSSSIQVINNNPYGDSKLKAEILLKKLSEKNGNKVFIDRLPGIFGPGARPNYNTVVATFCNNIICGENIELLNPDKVIKLLYIEDLIDSLLNTLLNKKLMSHSPVNLISIKDLARIILSFKDGSKIEMNIDEYFLKCLNKTYEYHLNKFNSLNF